jgi:hypothetical protein
MRSRGKVPPGAVAFVYLPDTFIAIDEIIRIPPDD